MSAMFVMPFTAKTSGSRMMRPEFDSAVFHNALSYGRLPLWLERARECRSLLHNCPLSLPMLYPLALQCSEWLKRALIVQIESKVATRLP